MANRSLSKPFVITTVFLFLLTTNQFLLQAHNKVVSAGESSNRATKAAKQILQIKNSTVTGNKPQLVIQLGHSEETPSSVTFSPNGKQVLTGGGLIACLWDVATGQEIRQFVGHSNNVNAVTFTPDGKYVLTGSSDKTARLWEVETGREIRQFVGHTDKINSLAVSFDGKYLLTGSSDKTALLWEIKKQQPVQQFVGHTKEITSVAFTTDGKLALTGSNDKTARLWNIAAGQTIRYFQPVINKVTMVAISPDSKYVATGSTEQISQLWDAQTGKMLRRFPLQNPESFDPYPLNPVVFSQDSQSILVGYADGCTLWNIKTGQKQKEFSDKNWLDMFSYTVRAVAFSPDGLQIIESNSLEINLWDINTEENKVVFEGYSRPVTSIALSPDNQFILLGQDYGLGKLWDVRGTQDLYPFAIEEGTEPENVTGYSVAFSPNGKNFLIRGVQEIRLWDIKTKQQIWYTDQIPTQNNDRGFAPLVAFSPDSNQVLTGSYDSDKNPKTVLLDIKTSRVVQEFKGHSRNILAVAFSSDGNQILTGSADTTARLWDIRTGQELRRFKHSGKVYSVAFSPDGSKALTGTEDGKVFIWNVQTSQVLNELSGHLGPVYSVVFSHDGQRILTGGNDGIAGLWDAQTGQKIRKFMGHWATISSVTFSSNDNIVMTGSFDSSIRLWDVKTGQELCQLISFSKGSHNNGYINNDWIVVTPEGRFDTSNLEEISGAHWVMPDDPLTPVSLVSFAREYYEPRLLARIMAGERFEPVKDITKLNRTKPGVKITDIASDSEDTVKVTLEVSRAKSDIQKDQNGKFLETGVFDVRLFRDGQLVGYAPETDGEIKVNQRTGKQTLTFPKIKLPRKTDVKQLIFSAYAFNVDRVKSETDRKAFNIPAKLTPVKGKAYVITVGVNAQENSKVPWLRYTVSDAKLTEQMLTERLKTIGEYREVVTVPLLADYDLEVNSKKIPLETATPKDFRQGKRVLKQTTATKQNFQMVLNLLAGKKVDPQLIKDIPNANQLHQARPEDLVVIFFSSHGATDDHGMFYLIPYNTGQSENLADVLRASISSDELTSWMRDVDGGEMVMIIDACYASAVVGTGFKPGPMGSRGLGQLSYDKGMRILCATQANNEAREGRTQIRHGLLTEALFTDGIKGGKADWDPVDKQIFGAEWLDYGVNRVPDLFEQEFGSSSKPSSKTGKFNQKTDTTKRLIEGEIQQEIQQRQIQKPSLFDFTRKKRDFILVRP